LRPRRAIAVAAAIGTALPGNAFYAATKAEVVLLTRRFAMELGPYGVTVNAVAPGFVRTDMTQGGSGATDWQWTEQRLAARAMMGRVGEPEDIAKRWRSWCHQSQAGSPHSCGRSTAGGWTTSDTPRIEQLRFTKEIGAASPRGESGRHSIRVSALRRRSALALVFALLLWDAAQPGAVQRLPPAPPTGG
jgi:hypothetical protein